MSPAPVLVTDLDGTLLRSDGSVSPRSVRALREAAARGWLIVYATARPAWSAVACVEPVGAGTFVISSNGAVVTEAASGRVVRTRSMAPQDVRPVIGAVLASGPEAAWAVDRPGDRLLSPGWPDVLASGPAGARRVAALPDGQGVLCLMAVGCPPGLGAALRRTWGVRCTSSASGLLEISAPGADKLSALDWILARTGLDRSHVLAFGDGPNDAELLEAAGHGTAVANACPEVLRVADELAPANDDDGVADRLEHVLANCDPSGRVSDLTVVSGSVPGADSRGTR